MKDFDAITLKAERNEAALKELADLFLISPKGVDEAKYEAGLLTLVFPGSALHRAYVDVDWNVGTYRVMCGCWSALTDAARKRIESQRFEDAKEALTFALDTFTAINNFFDTIGK